MLRDVKAKHKVELIERDFVRYLSGRLRVERVKQRYILVVIVHQKHIQKRAGIVERVRGCESR